ncbi:MAG: STAS-like domain-containing protein [Chloroflexota bacterium]
MTMFRVYDIVGENCITLADGQAMYDLVHPEISRGRAVLLDFAGVRVFASPFFNAAVGQLLRDLKPEELNARFTVTGLNPTGRSVLRAVIRNAKEYYANPANAKAIDEAVRDTALTA